MPFFFLAFATRPFLFCLLSLQLALFGLFPLSSFLAFSMFFSLALPFACFFNCFARLFQPFCFCIGGFLHFFHCFCSLSLCLLRLFSAFLFWRLFRHRIWVIELIKLFKCYLILIQFHTGNCLILSQQNK